jgi:hypothetical protein
MAPVAARSLAISAQANSHTCIVLTPGDAGDAGGRSIMSQNYIIEVHEQAAGIIVRDGPKYRFFAATHAFNPLEGRLFKNPREAERAVKDFLCARKAGRRSFAFEGATFVP